MHGRANMYLLARYVGMCVASQPVGEPEQRVFEFSSVCQLGFLYPVPERPAS